MLLKVLPRLFMAVSVVGLLCAAVHPVTVRAEEGFSLQVSPSPLVATVKPGVDSVQELQIRNTNTSPQALKMGLRTFRVDDKTGEVQLGNEAPQDIEKFVSFEQPTFSLQAGEIMTQRITIRTPASAGFTYSFAITVAQQNPPKPSKGKSAIAGTVAIFSLLNVDKPGATRKFELSSFSVGKHTYEYLPANFTVRLKNTGNTLVKPTGTLYIQRHSNDNTPLMAIGLNQAGGYILPGSSRTFESSWNDGFPHYETKTVSDGTTQQKLVWQGNAVSKLRFGRYVAKMVAVYDDGQRDVPIVAEVSFWVVPWKLILGGILILLFLVVGVIATTRSFGRAVRSAPRRAKKNSSQTTDEKDL